MNLLRVENFLLFFSLRCGALTILWSVMLWFFYTLIVFWCFMKKSSDHAVAEFFFYTIIVLFVGEVTAVLALIFFPAPNKVYSPNSITAKSLKYFAWYLGCAVVTFLVIFPLSTVSLLFERIKYSTDVLTYVDLSYILIDFVAIPFLVTAAILHLIAVMHTFRLSILSNKNLDEIKCP